LFYGYSKGKSLGFASELKGLHDICENVDFFPPGSFLTYKIGEESFTIRPYFNLDFRKEILINF